MKAHIQLLEYIIDMWDPDQDHFVVGVHILPSEVEDIYFLTDLSMRGSPLVLSRVQGGEGSLDDIIYQHFSLGIASQSGKLSDQVSSRYSLEDSGVYYRQGGRN